MASSTLASLPAVNMGGITSAELLYLVQSNADVQMTLAQLVNAIFSNTVQSAAYPANSTTYLMSGSNGSLNIQAGASSHAFLIGGTDTPSGNTGGKVDAGNAISTECGGVGLTGANAVATNTTGGSIGLTGGNGSGTAAGGSITLQPGAGGGASSPYSYAWVNLVAGSNGGPVPRFYVTGLPTSDPNDADAIWDNGGLLTRSTATGDIILAASSPGAVTGRNVTLTASAGTNGGGNISLTAGTGGSGNGGSITIQAGVGATPQGVGVYGGNTHQSGGTAGNVTIQGGTYDSGTGNSANGGWAIIWGGDAHTQGNGGDVRIKPGAGAGTGTQGNVYFVNLPTADPHHVGAAWNNAGVMTISAG